MSSKLLVAIDGSDGSKRALANAVQQAKLSGGKIILAYVIDWSPYSFHTPEELEERHQRRESEIQRAHDAVLDPELKKLNAEGISAEAVVRHGKIAETLNRISKETNTTQIYIGRHGESSIKSMIFGSVTGALVQSAAVPVTVVP